MSWIFLVLLYGLLKGAREIAKKKAMDTNSVMEVLVAYTVISLVLVIPSVKEAVGIDFHFLPAVAFKSFCMFLAWICSFYALKKLPVSLYGILSLSRVLFGSLLGVLLLHETLNVYGIFGLIFVCTGLLMLKFKPNRKGKSVDSQDDDDDVPRVVPLVNDLNEESPRVVPPVARAKEKPLALFVVIAFISCIMNSISGFMDKILMKDISSSELQFWYMLFIVLYYTIYVLIKREKISISVVKNKWVWILAVMFVIGDKALFIANANPESKITMMTLIKQSACIVTIIGGRFIFKEKGIGYKLLCASIVILGIVLGVIK